MWSCLRMSCVMCEQIRNISDYALHSVISAFVVACFIAMPLIKMLATFQLPSVAEFGSFGLQALTQTVSLVRFILYRANTVWMPLAAAL